ncbi:MAG: hypothetical protein KAS72_11115 [Phycisphaerales bacterium]|nr:hypothetical protein [Phycisphaerales bacterium]
MDTLIEPVPAVVGTDCEGTTVVNDNAKELASAVIPDGDTLFTTLSRFDDYIAYVYRRPDYNAGDTLRLIQPFLYAYGFTEDWFSAWAATKPLTLIDDAADAVSHIASAGLPVYEITVTYRPIALRVANAVGVPLSHVYCTDIPREPIRMSQGESSRVRHVARGILSSGPLPSLGADAMEASEQRLSQSTRQHIHRLERLIWHELPNRSLSARSILGCVRAMGGDYKAMALRHAASRSGTTMRHCAYIGDSITDVEVLRSLKTAGGAPISFNGDRHAVRAARYCCWGTSSLVPALLALAFGRLGIKALDIFASSGGKERDIFLADAPVAEMLDQLEKLENAWGVAAYSPANRQMILDSSAHYSRLIRPAEAGYAQAI